MDTWSIKVQHGHPDTKTGRIIRQLCNEIERLRQNERVRQFTYRQMAQLMKQERRRQPRRKAA